MDLDALHLRKSFLAMMAFFWAHTLPERLRLRPLDERVSSNPGHLSADDLELREQGASQAGLDLGRLLDKALCQERLAQGRARRAEDGVV